MSYAPFHFRMRTPIIVLCLLICANAIDAQNGMVGDGFGGRLWYRPCNFAATSYSVLFTEQPDPCDSTTNQLYRWGQATMLTGDASPQAVPGMTGVRYFTGGYPAAAIALDGTGYVDSTVTYADFVPVISDVKFVDAGPGHITFLKSDGTVWSVGLNSNGQFGIGTAGVSTSYLQPPTQTPNISDAVRVACGYSANFILRADGSVLAVGFNDLWMLGIDSLVGQNITTPVPLSGLVDIVDIKAHALACAALDADGNVYTWGAAYAGQGAPVHLPTRLEGLSNIVAISACADGTHFFALDAYRNCYAWGASEASGSDIGLGMELMMPVLVATDVVDIMAGENFSYILKSDGSLWHTGPNLDTWLGGIPPGGGGFHQMDLGTTGFSVQSTIAIPSNTCDSSSIEVLHFGGQAPYQFDIGTGPQGSPLFSDVQPGSYTVTVTDADGCTTTLPCTVPPGPGAVLAYSSEFLCQGGVHTLPWGATAVLTGAYTHTVSGNGACDTTYIVQLFVLPAPEVYRSGILCDGVFTLPSGVVVDIPGLYIDVWHVTGQCDTVYHFLVQDGGPSPLAGLTALDTLIVSGNSTQLLADGGESYVWAPPTGLACPTCASTLATPSGTTTYCVEVFSAGGCSDTACVRIVVEAPCAAESIYIPTAFSPNASGKNDTQCVYGACITTMVFSIYDRWGNKVFESADPKQCWDGTFKGQALDPAVFVYKLTATMTTGETVQKQGNITLVR